MSETIRQKLARAQQQSSAPLLNLPGALDARVDPPHLAVELAQLRTLIRQHGRQRATVEMHITKNMAEAMLFLRIKRNRRINRGWVNKLKVILADKRFHGDIARIIFDWDGDLRDAQHRLTAIFEADLEVAMDVTFGVDPDSFTAMDVGLRRTAAQFLDLEDVKWATVVASIVRLQYRIDHNGAALDDDGVYRLGKQIADDTMQIALHQATRLRKKMVILSAAALAYRMIALQSHRAHMLDEFWDRLALGDQIKTSSPVYKLREHFDRERNAKTRKAHQYLTQTQHTAWIILAWNVWVDGGTALGFKHTDANALPTVK